MMRRWLHSYIVRWLIAFLLAIQPFSHSAIPLFAQECNEGDPELQQICLGLNELGKRLRQSIEATKPLEKAVADLKNQIDNLQAKINRENLAIKNLEEDIHQREIDLAYQYEILKIKVRDYYKRSRLYSPLAIFLTAESASQLTRELSLRQATVNEDRRIITLIAQNIVQLKSDQQKLEEDRQRLAAWQKKLDQQKEFFEGEIRGAKAYQAQLSQQIARLTARQKALLAARAGTFTTSVGEVPVSNIPCSGPPGSPVYCDPGFSPAFAGFSFGAWTHRKGLSQYGAKGRAEAGQNYEQILEHYYGQKPVNKDTGGSISVAGFGPLDFENHYLLGIAEMPSSWPQEALKAQAVAARTFAYRYKTSGRTICTTQSCQVFSQSKAANPPPAWREAVEATRGQVIDGAVGYYSSTAGGYLTTSGWDTTDGQGGPGFASRAWESQSGSPWFYSSWFTQSYLSGSAKCGRSHPWLTEEEMADILNAWLVLQNQGSDERILPVTINQCPIGGTTGNPYSISELKDKANGYGGAFTSVGSVSVSYGNNGETSSLTFETNRGSISVSGAELKQAFNLRAPGYIALRSPLFNIEKK